MTYVITKNCLGEKDKSCVEVCPVDCFYDNPDKKLNEKYGVTVAGDDGSFYVIRLDSNDTEALKDDIITEIASYDTTSSDANTYFFKKYSFHVYDINLYNSIGNSSDYSSYLVQTPVDTAN